MNSNRRSIFNHVVLTFLALSGCWSTAFGQQTSKDEIPLYLPYHSSQFPEMAVQLNTALAEANLAHWKIKTADYWHPYQQGLRMGRPGVYLAAPHFTAWALRKHRFKPIVRLPHKLRYVIAARRDDTQFFEINDLANHDICSQQALNLDFLLIRHSFENTLRAANNKTVNSVSSAMQYDNRNCDAFSVSEHVFREFNKRSPGRFIRLQQGPEFNNYAFTAHRSISDDDIKRFKSFLRSRKIRTLMEPLLSDYSSDDVLLPIKPQDYPASDFTVLESYWAAGE